MDYVYKSGKPYGRGIRRAIAKTGLAREDVALVGDQLVTDVLAASVNGIRCILTEPIVLETGFFFRIKRSFESLIDRKRRNMKGYDRKRSPLHKNHRRFLPGGRHRLPRL